MSVLILTEKELRNILKIDRSAIDAVACGFKRLSWGKVTIPPIKNRTFFYKTRSECLTRLSAFIPCITGKASMGQSALSKTMNDFTRTAKKAASSSSPIMIQGENRHRQGTLCPIHFFKTCRNKLTECIPGFNRVYTDKNQAGRVFSKLQRKGGIFSGPLCFSRLHPGHKTYRDFRKYGC